MQLASFLGEASEGDGEAALGEARRLGLEERDVVIRRHLVQMMRLALAHLEPADMPPTWTPTPTSSGSPRACA